MYLLPLLLSNLQLGPDAPFDLLDPTIGRTNLVRPEELVSHVLDRYYPVNFDHGVLDFYYKPWMNMLNHKQHVIGTTSIDDNSFKITINVQQYKPEEVTVKVVDRWVIVEAKHEAKQDNGNVVSRQFTRRYLLPNRADVEQVTSTISSDGVLIITVPLKPEDEKVIKIEQTGQPAISSNSQKEAGASETTIEKKADGNETMREEVTAMQAQEAGPKPEKR